MTLYSLNHCDWFAYYENEYDTRLSDTQSLMVISARQIFPECHLCVVVLPDEINCLREVATYCQFEFLLRKYILSI